MSNVTLIANKEYWDLRPREKERLTNGCGTAGLIGVLVPDSLYQLSIKEACRIHDFMYLLGTTFEDRECADITFFYNMLRIIHAAKGPRWLQALRIFRARKYYWAVHWFGGPAFWADKQPVETMGNYELVTSEGGFYV